MKGLTHASYHAIFINLIKLEDMRTLEGIDTIATSSIAGPTYGLEDMRTLEGIDTINCLLQLIHESVRRYENP